MQNKATFTQLTKTISGFEDVIAVRNVVQDWDSYKAQNWLTDWFDLIGWRFVKCLIMALGCRVINSHTSSSHTMHAHNCTQPPSVQYFRVHSNCRKGIRKSPLAIKPRPELPVSLQSDSFAISMVTVQDRISAALLRITQGNILRSPI